MQSGTDGLGLWEPRRLTELVSISSGLTIHPQRENTTLRRPERIFSECLTMQRKLVSGSLLEPDHTATQRQMAVDLPFGDQMEVWEA